MSVEAPIKPGPSIQLTPIVSSAKAETGSAVATTLTGTIPTWLNGHMMRNGAAEWDLEKDGKVETVNHWFDGHALLHRFTITNGVVNYRNKFLRSEVYAKNRKYDRFIIGGFGTPQRHSDPCKNIFERFVAFFAPPESTDNCNVNIYPVGDRVFAFTETCDFREIDPETLESENRHKYTEFITVNQATAHPMTDADGHVYNMGNTFGKNTVYNIFKMPVNNKRPEFSQMEIVARIPATEPKFPSYYHSFSMTENHWLFLEMPYRFQLFKMMFRNKSTTAPADTLTYKEEAYSMFRHVEKKTGRVLDIKVNTKGMGCFHFGNAFEVEVEGITFIVWDQCPNFLSAGSTHLFNIDTLRSSVDDITKAFKEAGRNEAMRYAYPISIAGGAKPGDNLNERLKGHFDTTAKAILQEDGSILVEPEDLLSETDKKKGE